MSSIVRVKNEAVNIASSSIDIVSVLHKRDLLNLVSLYLHLKDTFYVETGAATGGLLA